MCNDSIILRLLDLQKEQIMSALSDKIAEIAASQDEAFDRVQADVADLQSQIDALKDKVTKPEDIAALDTIMAKNKAMDPYKPDVLPEPPPEPNPNPEPTPNPEPPPNPEPVPNPNPEPTPTPNPDVPPPDGTSNVPTT